jgi:hypothetical protein
MKRYLAALLMVLGVVGVVGVLAVGTGFAEDENAAGAKCSEATLDGTYLFAADGFNLKGNEQTPFATAGYEVYDGNGKVTGVQSGTLAGRFFVMRASLARIPSRRIAPPPSPITVVILPCSISS